MKKILAITLCLAMLALTACGQKQPQKEMTSATEVQTEATTLDDGKFDFQSKDLPKGWTIEKDYCTSTYLEALYGKGEDAPRLTVSVFTYDDGAGETKAKELAGLVHDREKESAADVKEEKIGGMDFYGLSYDSLMTEGKTCYIYFGQTKPDAKGVYKFVEIQLDRVTDAKQFETLKAALDTLDFKF